jgi:AraC family transcriptional regulator, arabinose operon regulatory protein
MKMYISNLFLYKNNLLYGDVMDKDKKLLVKNYLSNIDINVIVAAYTHCPNTWRELDYVPSYNKFYYIRGGEGWLKIRDKEFYPDKDQLFLLPAGIKQSYSVINDNPFTKYWCHFTATIGQVNLFDILQLQDYINIKVNAALEDLFKELILNMDSDEITASLRVKALLLQLITYYIENSVVEKIRLAPSSQIEKLGLVISYIDNHLDKSISIDSLSEMVHFHPNYFMRLFKKHFGVSPIHYINKIRMDRAKNLLKTTEMAIKEIAASVGFNDVFYFSKAFKSYTGFSPSEYRKVSR